VVDGMTPPHSSIALAFVRRLVHGFPLPAYIGGMIPLAMPGFATSSQSE
jgi:hypothetical protein